MVPFFSRRSILVLLLGLILGSLLGLGYWYVSPVKTEVGWPPVHLEGLNDSELYQSTVTIELMAPGAGYTSVKGLQRLGEYYATKMATSTFLEFLSEAQPAYRYPHTPEELAEMMRVRYDWKNEGPAIEIRVTSTDEGEAFYLASIVPEVFQDYLIEQEGDLYQDTLEKFDSVSAALVEARRELAALTPPQADHVELDLSYVIAEAKVEALERELGSLAKELASLSNGGSMEPEELSYLIIGDPSTPEVVPPDKIRGRNALMMGAVFGVAFAWAGLNFKGLVRRLRPSPYTASRLEEEDEEEIEEQE